MATWRKVIALTKEGGQIVTAYVSEDETLGDILAIISDKLAPHPISLDIWRDGGYIVKFGKEV